MDALEPIKQKIYEIRGRRVMLDKDLADLYQVTTGNLNKAVKRNIKRFPPDFMFQLTNAEFEELKANLIFQNGTSSWGGTRKLPFAFTREGIAMLSGILRSEVAVQANINIMRAFFQMQEALLTGKKPCRQHKNAKRKDISRGVFQVFVNIRNLY